MEVQRFELPVSDDVIYLNRTHPIVEGLASYVMDAALDPLLAGVARRCGATRTRAVTVRTTLLLARFLTAYLFKVVITAKWPSGWIGYLVSTVAATGILALLLVHPVAGRDDKRWVGTFSRWFYIVLMPAIVMLLFALGKRIGQYGITERRYLLLVLALWLAATTVWFVTGRRRSIKWIPVTLCLVAFATSCGPWGAYAVSRRSQLGRLEALLARNGLLGEGGVRPAAAALPLADRREIGAVLRYLIRTHGSRALRPRSRGSGRSPTTSKATWMEGETWSSYSTSASARAVRSTMHQ